MTDLLARAAHIVDSGEFSADFNPTTGTLHELAEGVAMIDAFSHVVILDGGDGLSLFDVSHLMFAERVVEALRSWSDAPLRNIVYTHGHVDHVGGADALIADNANRGHVRPAVVAHEAVNDRFDRYTDTAGYNGVINARQFGGSAIARATSKTVDSGAALRDIGHQWLAGIAIRPSVTYRDHLGLQLGDRAIELHHGRGETDDHTWVWDPERKIAIVGDFVTWVFPNAGNPQKVQRYALEWAQTLRRIIATGPELLLPAHGLPLEGHDRIAIVLGDMATALEQLTHRTLELMNDGATLDTVLGEVRLDADLAGRPWLVPVYDEPEFIVRNVWRLYGGWYDGNPARLKPPRDAAIAVETASLAGGVDVLVARAKELAASEDLPLACHLIELAVTAAPDDAEAHGARFEIYKERRKRELSLMAKGIYGQAARISEAVAGIE
ncbi:MAG TPA: alkyl sulfatase dimerization domain-containing protein [Acidimicrobiales bacterium]|nr:alkyl sulfatase dimerization domain-containing protein [Acidimicrobiales bacterium]